MRGTASALVICIGLIALAACAGKAKAPATRLVQHTPPAAPAAAAPAGEQHAVLAQPQEWWTTGGGYLRRCSSAAAGPSSGAQPLRVAIPAIIDDGPFIDGAGQAWVLAGGVLYSVAAGDSTARARSDAQRWYYRAFTLCPDGGVLAIRLPFHTQFRGETLGATFEPFASETQLARLTAAGKEQWAWDAKCALVCPLLTPAGDAYCLSYIDSYQPTADTTKLLALNAAGRRAGNWRSRTSSAPAMRSCSAPTTRCTLPAPAGGSTPSARTGC